MSKRYFTSDTHFDHHKIIGYCNRPFEDVADMNRTLVRNWNQRVKSDDFVFVLGDFCFHNKEHGFLFWDSQLNGHKVYITGNHDRKNKANTRMVKAYLEIGNHYVCLIHEPNYCDMHCSINLVGHVHEKWKIQENVAGHILYNVGVDVQKFMPVTWDEIMRDISHWKKRGKKDEEGITGKIV